jgi:hypothetical protein
MFYFIVSIPRNYPMKIIQKKKTGVSGDFVGSSRVCSPNLGRTRKDGADRKKLM